MDGSLPRGQAIPTLPPLPVLGLPPPEEPAGVDFGGAGAGAALEVVGLGAAAGALLVAGEVAAGAGAVERGLQRLDEVARFFFAATAWWRLLWRAWWTLSTDRAETGLGPKEAITARQEMASRLSNLVKAMT